MKKRICIALAAFMITICAAGCQNSRNIDVTKEVDSYEAGVTEIVPDTTAANAVKEKVSEVGQNGGPPAGNSQGGEAAEGQQKTSEATETELQMTYTYENGVLNVSVTIPVGPPKSEQNPDTEKNAGSAAVNNSPHKQMVLQMTDDGRILIQSPDADGTMTSAYYRKTDSFENFDWSSVHFDFDSLNAGE